MTLSGKKICLTGATGFLGSHLLPLLKQAGMEITCIVRPSSNTQNLDPDVRIAQADLIHGTGLAEAMRGQDMVVHMAALLFGLGWQDYLGANTAAARQIGLAARDVERVLHVSSLAAAGPCARLPGIAESDIPAPVSAYGWYKLLSENILGNLLGARLVVLRPPIIYGSGDRGLLPVFRGIRRGFAAVPGRKFPVSVIHARDAAQAIIACLDAQASGTYHVSDGRPMQIASFYRAIAKALGSKRLLTVNMPLPIMGASAAFAGLYGRLGKIFGAPAPKWNPDKYREARAGGWLANDQRIRRELDFEPVMTLSNGLAETVEGYRTKGLL